MDTGKMSIATQVLGVGFLFILVALVVVWGSGQLNQPAGEHSVTYKLTGSTTIAVVTYSDSNGKQTSPENIGLPWTKKVYFSQAHTVVLTASNPTQTGNLQCDLYIDDQLWETQRITAPEDRLSCAGIVP